MEVTFTEYDSDGFEIVASDTHVLKDCALAPHDMVLTEHYVMLKINSLEMDQVSFLSGAKGPAECLRMDGRAQVKAFVFPRPTLSAKEKEQYRPFVVEDIPACFSIHFSQHRLLL
jgi:all-trans-8'-apo-beta-carotenal 15,15'-oxygenase